MPTSVSHAEGATAESEELTWRDYDPMGGMPLPIGELPQTEISSIFGPATDVDTGNYILSVMHYRRMSGSLIDAGLTFPSDTGVTPDMAMRGLDYVRTLMPGFDESDAGDAWAEEEAAKLEQELIQRAENIGIYKKLEAEEDVEQEPQRRDDPLYGKSELLELRRRNEAIFEQQEEQRKKDEAKREAEKLARQIQEKPELVSVAGVPLAGVLTPGPSSLQAQGPGGVSINQPTTKAWLQPIERKQWVKYYEKQAEIIKENRVPQLSVLRRLGPGLLLTLAVVGLCVFLSDNYAPPPKSARIWPDTPPAVATIGALTAVLCAGFVLGRLPFLWRTFSKYGTIVPAYPYAISLLGAGFRHDTLVHLASNLVSLWLFGLMLHEDVGRGTFLAIYFGAGMIGGYSSLLYNVLNNQWLSYIFGSSGCVLGVVGAACALHPYGKISILGYDVPIAAWAFLAAYAGFELVAAVRMRKTTIDHAGHIGGLAGGVGAALYLRQRTDTRDRMQAKIQDRAVKREGAVKMKERDA